MFCSVLISIASQLRPASTFAGRATTHLYLATMGTSTAWPSRTGWGQTLAASDLSKEHRYVTPHWWHPPRLTQSFRTYSHSGRSSRKGERCHLPLRRDPASSAKFWALFGHLRVVPSLTLPGNNYWPWQHSIPQWLPSILSAFGVLKVLKVTDSSIADFMYPHLSC